VKNVGTVHLGPDLRRGVAELNGEGEVVGGIVVMRYGENALRVIDGIKKKLEEIKPSLPEGVELITTYDRSQLIKRSIATLREKLIEESIVVALVCLVFLWQHPIRAGGNHHPADSHSAFVSSADVLDGAYVQHHVAGGNRDCDWRDGGLGHHHGRKCAQVPGALSRGEGARTD